MYAYVERVSVFLDEKDCEFSERLWKEFCDWAYQRYRLTGFAMEIAEKYDDEDTPHYHMFWVHENFKGYFLDGNFVKIHPEDVEFSISYKASADGEVYRGTVKIRLFADSDDNEKLAREVFVLYDEYVQEYYPEWETEYLEDTRHCAAIVEEAKRLHLLEDGGTISWELAA